MNNAWSVCIQLKHKQHKHTYVWVDNDDEGEREREVKHDQIWNYAVR